MLPSSSPWLNDKSSQAGMASGRQVPTVPGAYPCARVGSPIPDVHHSYRQTSTRHASSPLALTLFVLLLLLDPSVRLLVSPAVLSYSCIQVRGRIRYLPSCRTGTRKSPLSPGHAPSRCYTCLVCNERTTSPTHPNMNISWLCVAPDPITSIECHHHAHREICGR